MRDKSQRQTVLASAATIVSDSVPAVGRLSVLPEAPLLSIPFEERYATDRTLGSGGMGTVLACHDRVIGREIAVKLMLPSLAPSPDAVWFMPESGPWEVLEYGTFPKPLVLTPAPDSS